MHKRRKQFNSSGIKWPTEVDMPLKKTQTQKHEEMLKNSQKKIFLFS